MTVGWRAWAMAGTLSLGLHALLVAGFDPRERHALERSAGEPDAIWGIAVSALSDAEATAPARPVSEAPTVEPDEMAHETEAASDAAEASSLADAPAEAIAAEGPVVTQEARSEVEAEPEAAESARNAAEAAPDLPQRKPDGAAPPPRRAVERPQAPASGGPVGRAAGSSGRTPQAGGRAEVSNYSGRVLAHLQRHKRYPAEAQQRGMRGTARLTFVLGPAGEVRSARLASGSGHAMLDREALAMVRRAAPFPRFPPGLQRSSMTFTVPVRYSP